MIKNKEATDSAAVEFCSYFEQIADSPNFLRKLALKLCFRQKPLKLRHSSNWAANLLQTAGRIRREQDGQTRPLRRAFDGCRGHSQT